MAGIDHTGRSYAQINECVYLTKSEPFLNGTDGALRATESIGKIPESQILVPMSGIEPLSRACLPPHQFELECRRADLNCRPGAYETPALTTELPRH